MQNYLLFNLNIKQHEKSTVEFTVSCFVRKKYLNDYTANY